MLMTRNQIIRFAFVLLVSFSTAFIGCSGSGDSTSSGVTPTAALNVLPSDYDFGTVTEGNVATPRQFEIQNNGTADLRVTSIVLSGTDAAFFDLNPNGGADPCGSLNPTIDPGGSCTVSVGFDPTDGFRAYSAALVIQSNDPNTPTSSLTLDGAYAPIIGSM